MKKQLLTAVLGGARGAGAARGPTKEDALPELVEPPHTPDAKAEEPQPAAEPDAEDTRSVLSAGDVAGQPEYAAGGALAAAAAGPRTPRARPPLSLSPPPCSPPWPCDVACGRRGSFMECYFCAAGCCQAPATL